MLNMPRAKRIIPRYNMGCTLDIPTGSFVKGRHGNAILNGGLVPVSGIVGPGNVGKSELVNLYMTTLLGRYENSFGHTYDTEVSMQYERLERSLSKYPAFDDVILDEENDRYLMVTSDQLWGDEWFQLYKDKLKERSVAKYPLRESPFMDMLGKPILVKDPFFSVIDSLTQFQIKKLVVDGIESKALGDSKNNMFFAHDGKEKTLLITQTPNLTAKAGASLMTVAHVGVKMEIDTYAAPPPKLTHSGRGRSTKGVPEKYQSINGHVIEILGTGILNNSSKDKSCRYPLHTRDRVEGAVDLLLMRGVSTRNKYGPSGVTYNFVISQSEGIDPLLTEFHHNKMYNTNGIGFGMHGNTQNYALDLLPECKLSRTVIRKKLAEVPELGVANGLTCDLLQMQQLWGPDKLDPAINCTPQELYDDIKKLGYDWSELLKTRRHWVYPEFEDKELPQLTIMDLLLMRAGEYKPYWM